jgi:hypothetical protein
VSGALQSVFRNGMKWRRVSCSQSYGHAPNSFYHIALNFMDIVSLSTVRPGLAFDSTGGTASVFAEFVIPDAVCRIHDTAPLSVESMGIAGHNTGNGGAAHDLSLKRLYRLIGCVSAKSHWLVNAKFGWHR